MHCVQYVFLSWRLWFTTWRLWPYHSGFVPSTRIHDVVGLWKNQVALRSWYYTDWFALILISAYDEQTPMIMSTKNLDCDASGQMMIGSTVKLQMRIFEPLTVRQSRTINLDNCLLSSTLKYSNCTRTYCTRKIATITQNEASQPLAQDSVRVSWHILEKISSQESDPDQPHMPHAEKQSMPFS